MAKFHQTELTNSGEFIMSIRILKDGTPINTDGMSVEELSKLEFSDELSNVNINKDELTPLAPVTPFTPIDGPGPDSSKEEAREVNEINGTGVSNTTGPSQSLTEPLSDSNLELTGLKNFLLSHGYSPFELDKLNKRFLDTVRLILKNGGMDTQQQEKALVEISAVLNF